MKIITVVLCAALLAGGYFFWVMPVNRSSARISIEQGMTAGEIASALKDKGIIPKKTVFLRLLELTRKDREIKRGMYEFSAGENYAGIIHKLVSGDIIVIKLTVPEGFRAEQIAGLIADFKLGDRDKFMDIVNKNKLEGCLFPDTYFVSMGSSAQDIADMMVNRFEKVFSQELLEEGEKYNFSKNDIVTLGSIIEKEAMKKNERSLISSVFHNRLKKRCYLESCATVQYALGEHKEKLSYKDLQVKSPYNTYRHYGLPPGPICNPGLDSLKAAVFPEKTELMYFVSNGDGTHTFSRDYKTHLEVQ